MGITPETLPDEGFEYWADGPVCLVFHPAMWPGVWGVHVAIKPDGRGRAVEPAKRLLSQFWASHGASRIVAWIDETNRAVNAYADRCGFVNDGAFPGIIMKGWTPCP